MQEVITCRNCSFNELMILNVETVHTSPSDYLHAVAVRSNAGVDSYFESANYVDHAKEVMNDMKTLGNWDSYLAYEKWIQNILNYASKMKNE